MANLIQKFKAKKRIPREVYSLIKSIHDRYSLDQIREDIDELGLNNRNSNELNEREKLSKLINMINNDTEIKTLPSLAGIVSIKILRQIRGRTTDYGLHIPSQGNGINLCIGQNGLYIYDWDDGREKYSYEIPLTPDSFAKYFGKIDAKELRKAIIECTDRENYIEDVADFGRFTNS